MGRPRDEYYWNQVTKEEDGTLKCKRCGKMFKGGVARIKAHLGKEKGRGIALCDRSNAPINEGVNNDTMAEAGPSINLMEVVDGMNSIDGDQTIDNYFDGSMNHQNDAEPSNIVEGSTHVNDEFEWSNASFQCKIDIIQIQDLVDGFSREEDRIKEELQWLVYRGKKRQREVDDRIEEVKDLNKRARETMDSLKQGRLIDLKEEIKELKFDLWGKAHEVFLHSFDLVDRYLKKMRELLRDDKVFFIGVHGMGGVGKTWLVTHIKNQITRKGTFNLENVFWVTVSQDFSIFKLQNRIAGRIGIKLDDEDEVFERAESLSSALEKKERLVLILDDVWNYIDLQKVGIPLGVNGIKLIVTSRLKHVFQQMDCQPGNIIQMEPLPNYDDDYKACWELFLLKLGCNGTPATLPSEVENIARSIVKRCDGLPLGISVMARTMKGVNDLSTWRCTLNKLENSEMGEEMKQEVLKVLKLSYDHLMDINIQNCFLQLALYHLNTYDYMFDREEFAMNLVDEGLIKARESLEEIFDEGRVIIDKLQGHSLLREDDGYLLMHGFVREMASHIVKGRYLVKCNKKLTKIPDIQEWTPYLEKVSLMHNDIREIPEGTSPNCPVLSTLIFSHNILNHIPNCFFNCMGALSLLDLSNNGGLKRLPSLSNLRSLKSLLLKGCYQLEDVPPLGELQELSTLVISGTAIKQVPQGLAMLVKLKWLDLSWNNKLTFSSGSMLQGLTNMQYLNLRSPSVTVQVENIQGMSRLEYFGSHIQVGNNLVADMENIMDKGSGPKYYDLSFGNGSFELEGFEEDPPLSLEPRVWFEDCEALDHFLLPRNLHRLLILRNEQWSGGLCDALSFKASSSLRKIQVSGCPKLERLFCLSGSCSLCKHLQNLQSLFLHNLEGLDVILEESDGSICLPNLSCLQIWGCDNMEKLLAPLSLRQLPNLETIQVEFCDSMKEIFATRSSEDDNIDSTITLPKSFKKLTLCALPQLKTVCANVIVSESRPTLDVSRCPNLINDSFRWKSSHSDPDLVILLQND